MHIKRLGGSDADPVGRAANRSYVFFRITGLSNDGEPVGAQGVPLTPGKLDPARQQAFIEALRVNIHRPELPHPTLASQILHTCWQEAPIVTIARKTTGHL